MSTDQAYRKSGSPEASTEVSSLQVNRSKNKEALEKRLRSRRPVKELVNQGILLNPAISNPDKVLQLQRAKTSDLLKRKIEQRPDRQYLISHHILRDDKPGTSPFILEQCHNLEKSQLKETLATKLISRPGSLELVEKGVLQVDPGVDSLIKQGSIPYPRVEPVLYQRTSSERLQPIQELAAIPSPPPLSLSTKTHNNSVRATSGRNRFVISNKTAGSRAIRDDTVVSKLGSLVFHQYCPDSSSSSSPSLSSISSPQQKQLVRELQQAEMLRLQDTARAHRLVERELCERVGMTYNKPAQDDIYVDLTSDLSHHDQIDGQPASSHNSNLFSAHTSLCTSNAIMCPKNQISSTSLRTNTSKVSSLDSTFSSPSLAHLNLTQLKGECKNRNLPRVGTKMQLMRLLDPYRHEILAKYFPNSVMHWNEERKSETNEHSQPSNCVLQQTQSSLQHQDHDHMLELNSRQASEVISERQMIGVNIRDFDSLLLSHTEPVSVCTTMLSSGSTLSKGLQEYSDIVMGSNCSNVLVAQPCVPLRHSVSAPFFSETSSESSAATGTRFQIPSGQGNISSTTLIPVTFLVDSASESDQISQIPVSSVGLQFVRTATKQSVVCVTPNLFPDAQTSNNGFGSENVNTSYYPVTDHLSKLNYTSSSQPLPLSTSIDSLSSCSETRSAHHIPVQNLLDNPVILYSQVGRTGSPSSTTLHQIEEMWLRIRQLRRNIAQSTTSQYISVDGETASNPGNLEHLQQEHNRLAVLCRLLIIERLDTLDEMDTNDKQNFHELKSPCSSDFKIERNLLTSYLRRLGGSLNTDSVSSSTTSSLTVNSITNTPSYATSVTLQTPEISGHSDSYPMRPNSRYDDHRSIEVTDNTNCYNDFNNREDGKLDNTDVLLNHHHYNNEKPVYSNLQNSPVSGLSKPYTYDAALEQLPSPMTTDILFELWNSVVEDNNSEQSKSINVDSCDSDMTVDLVEGNHGLCSSHSQANEANITTNTTNIGDNSNFYSVPKCDIENIPMADNNGVDFSRQLCHTVGNLTGGVNNSTSSSPTTAASNTIATVHSSDNYSAINGAGISVSSSSGFQIPIHQLLNNLSSSVSHSQNFVLHPVFYSQNSVHHSSPTVSNNPRNVLNPHSQFDPVWSDDTNMSHGIFNSKDAPHILSTNKHDTLLPNYTEPSSVCSMNSSSMSQTYTPATTEFVDTLFGSFDDSGLVELMDTADSSSIASFPVSLGLNWSIGT